MSHSDKVEVMDLLINVLKDHEKHLDTMITRAEYLLEEKKGSYQFDQKPAYIKISLKDWKDFKDCAIEANLICFDLIESIFYCNAITDTKIYKYVEKTPETQLNFKENENDIVISSNKMGDPEKHFSLKNRQLSIGLMLNARKNENNYSKPKIEFDIDSQYTKKWLSNELKIHRDFIIQGYLEH
jgi:hypothetical protein